MASRWIWMTMMSLVAVAAAVRPAAAQPYEYLVTDLGALGGPQSSAFAINGTGQVVGFSTVASADYHGILYDGALTDLGTTTSHSQSAAFAINDGGQIAGESYNLGDIQSHAMLWQGGTFTDLGSFSPRGINSAGSIAGHVFVYFNDLWVEHACLWSAGVVTDLGTLGGRCSQAYAVNNGGRVVGQSYLVNNVTLRACLWQDGAPHDLGALAGTAAANSSAAAVNDNGQIVGWSDTASGLPHAFWVQVDSGGNVTTRTDLGALSGGYSYAYGINEAGDVVGMSNACAILWRAGQIIDLTNQIPAGAGWTLARANAINAGGEIVGEGFQLGFPHAFLLTPVSCTRGDVNGDGFVNGLDAQAFVDVLMIGGTPREICAADMGTIPDGQVTDADIVNFVLCLLELGSCH